MTQFVWLRRKPNKLYFLYFISFFLVILVPVSLLSFYSYQLAYTSIVKEIRNADYNTMQQTSSSLNRLFDDLLTMSIQLGLDGRIYAASENSQSSFLLNDVKDRITSLANENAYVHNIQLYFFHSKLMISSDGPNRTLNGPQQDPWIAEMHNSDNSVAWLPSRTFVNHDGNAYDLATIVVSLPVAFPTDTGYAAIHFYGDKLNAYLEEMDADRNSMAYLATQGGAIIASYESESVQDKSLTEHNVDIGRLISSGDNETIRGMEKKALVTVGEPLNNGWRLLSITPLDYVQDKMSYVRNVILLADGLLIALGLAISYLLSRTMYNPIKTLLDKIKRYQRELPVAANPLEGQSLTAAANIVEQAFVRHRQLESIYRMNYEGMVERFLYQLFYNRLNLSDEELQMKVSDLGLPVTTAGFVTMLLEIDQYAALKQQYSASDLNLLRYAVRNIVQEVVAAYCPCLIAETEDHQTAILMNIEAEDYIPILANAADAVREAIEAHLPFTITVAFGAKVEHMRQSHLSFRYAQEVMRHKLVLPGAGVLYPEQLPARDHFEYFYPTHLEKAMTNHLRAGDYKQALQSLENMREELRLKPNLSYENVFRLYNRLIDAIMDMVDDTGAEWSEVYGTGSVYQELAMRDSIDSIHDWMSQVLHKACVAMQHLARPSTRVDEAIDFIMKHYQEDISVEQIAGEVQLNAAYLSRLFKQSVGRTILEYLTQVRMNESKRLLTKTRMSVQELAAHVGYNNTTSFIRVFRKHEGITPGEYRRLHAPSETESI